MTIPLPAITVARQSGEEAEVTLTGVQGLKTVGGHAILGLPLFVDRFTHASRASGEASFSGLLGGAGCQSLGLLEGAAEVPAGEGAAPAPKPATAVASSSGASYTPSMWAALALGLAALASWL